MRGRRRWKLSKVWSGHMVTCSQKQEVRFRRFWQRREQCHGKPLQRNAGYGAIAFIMLGCDAVLETGDMEAVKRWFHAYKRKTEAWNAQKAKGRKKMRRPRRSWVWSAKRESQS